MQSEEQFLREVKSDLRKDKIINFFIKYKFYIILIIVFICIGIGSYFAYDYYITNKAEKNSISFYNAKELLEKQENTKAIAILDDLIKDGTLGYKMISSLEKLKILLNDNKIKEAVELLHNSRQSLKSLPAYYLDLFLTLEFIIRINSDIDDKTLLNDIKNALNVNDTYYLFNLEMYASLLIKTGKYQEALVELKKISTSDVAPQGLKDRASRIENLVLGYIG